MANAKVINVGGTDYNIKDQIAREDAANAASAAASAGASAATANASVATVLKEVVGIEGDVFTIPGYGFTSSGEIAADDDEKVTDFLKITDSSVIISSSFGAHKVYCVFYDASKQKINYVSTSTTAPLNPITVPSGAVYVRAATELTDTNGYVIGAVYTDLMSLDGKIDTTSQTLTGQINTVSQTLTGQINTVSQTLSGQITTLSGTVSGIGTDLNGTKADLASVKDELIGVKGDPFTISGYGFNSSGEVAADEDEKITDYLKIIADEVVISSSFGAHHVYCVFYDSGKQKISYVSTSTTSPLSPITVPSGSVYVRAGTEINDTNGYVFGATADTVINLSQNVHEMNDELIGLVGDLFTVSGYGFNSSGNVATSIYEKITDYLRIVASNIVISSSLSSGVYCVFYNSSFEKISYVGIRAIAPLSLIPVPSGAVYVRASTRIEDENGYVYGAVLYNLGELQANIEKADVKATNTGPLTINDTVISMLDAEVVARRTNDRKSAIKFKQKIGNQFSIRMHVKFPGDVQCPSVNNQRVEFLSVAGTKDLVTSVQRVALKKITNTTPDHGIGYCPVQKFNAFVGTAHNDTTNFDTRINSDGAKIDFLKGEEPMSIRFTGDCTVEANHDICLIVDDTNITIKHENTNTVIASYTKSSYATLTALYNQMNADTESGNDLEDFEVKLISVGDYTPDDIIPGKVYLVSQYYRNNAMSQTEWDAFPYYFTTKGQNRIYTVDFLLNKDCSAPCQLVIDGYGVICGRIERDRWEAIFDRFFNNEVTIQIGSSEEDNGGIEILDFELSNNAEGSYPIMRICYAENIHEGTVPPEGPYNPTTEKMLTEVRNLFVKDNGFKSVSLKDIIDVVNGENAYKGKMYHFSHDDTCLPAMTNQHLREVYLANGLIPSFGLMMDQASTWDAATLATMNACNMIDWYFMIHTMVSGYAGRDVAYFSYEDLETGVNTTINKFAELFGKFPTVWDFHHTTENYNVITFLKTKGIRFMFGGSGTGLVSKLSRFGSKRKQASDNADLSNLYYAYDTYLNTETGVN